jgi:hypothetical protein
MAQQRTTSEATDMERIRIEQHSFVGGLWFAAWLFTIGFLHLHFWKGLLAIVVWPYYLGTTLSSLLHPLVP